jgi:hypothetical protein
MDNLKNLGKKFKGVKHIISITAATAFPEMTWIYCPYFDVHDISILKINGYEIKSINALEINGLNCIAVLVMRC